MPSSPSTFQIPATNHLEPKIWSCTATRDNDGVLVVGGVRSTDLVTKYGTPTFVLDEIDFRQRACAFRDSLINGHVFYAGKAFLCSTVVRWLAEEGLYLDVCSAGELAVALRSGFPADHIEYHGNNKTAAELRQAVDAGVGRIIVDSMTEIDRLAAIAAVRNGPPVSVLLRVTAGVEAHTHAHIATAHEDQKFGLSIASGAAWDAISRIFTAPGLELRGLHSHIGSQIFNSEGHAVAARRVLALQARVASETGVHLPELNLGGGFGIAYTASDEPMPPAQLMSDLLAVVERECAALHIPVPQLLVEPGRAIVGPAMCTLYTVGTVKPVVVADGGTVRTYVAVDGGMSNNIRPALYGAEYTCVVATRCSTAAAVLSRVVGKHCEAGDVEVRNVQLPGDVQPGDVLAVPATGAYGWSMASNYNHSLRPPVLAVREGHARVIVRRETEEDLFATDVGISQASLHTS